MTAIDAPLAVPRWTAELFVADAGELAECPRWDDRTGRLLWVDIYAGTLNSVDASGADRRSQTAGLALGSFAPREGEGYVLALETGFALSGAEIADWTPVGRHRTTPSALRSNDGSCDPAGRFFAGTMAHDEAPHAGELLCLDVPARGQLPPTPVPVLSRTTVSNGIGWLADGSRAYYVDSHERRLDVFDCDPDTGAFTNRRALISFGPDDGYPDGLTVDAEDQIWVAFWDGGVVRRFSPDGGLTGLIDVPVPRVSSCTFGGVNLDEVFITSASHRLTAAERAQHPLSGSIFQCRPGVSGVPVRRYNG